MALSSCIYFRIAPFLTGCLHIQLLIQCLHPRLGPLCPNFCCYFGFNFWLTILCFMLCVPLLMCHGIMWTIHRHLVRAQSLGRYHHHHLGNCPHYRWLSHRQDDQNHCPQCPLCCIGRSHRFHHLP